MIKSKGNGEQLSSFKNEKLILNNIKHHFIAKLHDSF